MKLRKGDTVAWDISGQERMELYGVYGRKYSVLIGTITSARKPTAVEIETYDFNTYVNSKEVKLRKPTGDDWERAGF